mgnify:CR=1 FL=1
MGVSVVENQIVGDHGIGTVDADPATLAARVNDFLGGGLDAAAMAAAVDPGLRRQRA